MVWKNKVPFTIPVEWSGIFFYLPSPKDGRENKFHHKTCSVIILMWFRANITYFCLLMSRHSSKSPTIGKTIWGAVCNITNSVDRIQFCWTEYNSVWQNYILSTECNSVQQNTNSVDRIVFCRQNYILSNIIRILLDRITFCRQNVILSNRITILLDRIIFCWTELHSVESTKCNSVQQNS